MKSFNFYWKSNNVLGYESKSGSVMSDPNRFFCPRNSSGKNTWVGCHSLLQRVFLNLGPLHCWQTLYQWSHLVSPNQWYINFKKEWELKWWLVMGSSKRVGEACGPSVIGWLLRLISLGKLQLSIFRSFKVVSLVRSASSQLPAS